MYVLCLKALCWYDLTMTQEDFDEKDEVTKSVNNWAIDVVKQSVKLIAENGDSEEQDKNYLPIAGTVYIRTVRHLFCSFHIFVFWFLVFWYLVA